MRSTRLTEERDRGRDLRTAIERTGYYPEVVADAVAGAVAGEQVVSFYVHHEPTFERDEVRRHQSVVVLTPTRLVLAHTDEHAGDDLLPGALHVDVHGGGQPVGGEVGGRHPDDRQPDQGPAAARGGGADDRLGRRQPARPRARRCNDPQCEADHGYTGVLASDDFSLRVSAAADGSDAVDGLLSFAESLSARTH